MPNFNVCGTLYPYPDTGDNPWGSPHIAWAGAVSSCLTSINDQLQTSIASAQFSAQGSLITSNVILEPQELIVGSENQVLQVVGGLPTWQTLTVSGGVPLGGHIPWDDFNGALSLQAGWEYADGTTVTTVGSPLFGQTKKDLSGAYIVGFGTLGGGNIGTSTYSSVAVGNANHQIDIRHRHSMVHTHGSGTYAALWTQNSSNGDFHWQEVGTSGWTSNSRAEDDPDSAIPGTYFTGVDVAGSSGSASTSNTGYDLSETQNIQPLSYRFRFIVRVL